MLIGHMTNPSENIFKEIERISLLNFDFPEICIEPPKASAETLMKNVSLLRKRCKDFKTILFHSPWYAELAIDIQKVRKAWLEYSKEIVELGRKLEVEKITFHPYTKRHVGIERKNYRKKLTNNLIKSLQEILENTKNYGIKILLENTGYPELSEIGELKDIFKEVKGLGMTFDIGHAYLHGKDEEINELIKHFQRKIFHLHVHDNFGEKDYHLPIGVGNIDWNKIGRVFKKLKNCNTATLEIFKGNHEYLLLSKKKFFELINKNLKEK